MAIDLEALAARYAADVRASSATGKSSVQHRLVLALEAIGWRAASDVPADDVAPRLASTIGACLRQRGDVRMLRRELAECLRQYAHPLDGSSASRAEWEPAATRIIELYAGQDEVRD